MCVTKQLFSLTRHLWTCTEVSSGNLFTQGTCALSAGWSEMKSEKETNVSIFSLRIEQRGCILLEVAGKTLQPSLSKHHCVQRITTIDKLSGLFLGSIAYEQKQPAELAHTRTSIPCTSTQPLNIWSICNLFLSFLSFQVQSSIAFIYIWHQNAFQTPSDNPLHIGISITHLIRNSKHGSLDV